MQSSYNNLQDDNVVTNKDNAKSNFKSFYDMTPLNQHLESRNLIVAKKPNGSAPIYDKKNVENAKQRLYIENVYIFIPFTTCEGKGMLRFCYHLTTVGYECDQKHKSPMSIETLEDVLPSGVTVSK